MSTYRCCFLGNNTHIRDVHEISCEDDSKAVALAQNYAARHDFSPSVEVWQDVRLIWSGRCKDVSSNK